MKLSNLSLILIGFCCFLLSYYFKICYNKKIVDLFYGYDERMLSQLKTPS